MVKEPTLPTVTSTSQEASGAIDPNKLEKLTGTFPNLPEILKILGRNDTTNQPTVLELLKAELQALKNRLVTNPAIKRDAMELASILLSAAIANGADPAEYGKFITNLPEQNTQQVQNDDLNEKDIHPPELGDTKSAKGGMPPKAEWDKIKVNLPKGIIATVTLPKQR